MHTAACLFKSSHLNFKKYEHSSLSVSLKNMHTAACLFKASHLHSKICT